MKIQTSTAEDGGIAQQVFTYDVIVSGHCCCDGDADCSNLPGPYEKSRGVSKLSNISLESLSASSQEITAERIISSREVSDLSFSLWHTRRDNANNRIVFPEDTK